MPHLNMNSNKIIDDTRITSDRMINDTPMPKNIRARIYDEVSGFHMDTANMFFVFLVLFLLIILGLIIASSFFVFKNYSD